MAETAVSLLAGVDATTNWLSRLMILRRSASVVDLGPVDAVSLCLYVGHQYCACIDVNESKNLHFESVLISSLFQSRILTDQGSTV